MEIVKTTDISLIKEILTDPKLYSVTGSITPIDEFIVDKNFEYLLIKNQISDEIYGCFQIKPFTATIVEAHINILSKYWGKDVAIKASNLGFEWMSKNTKYLKVITDVPTPCEHVHVLCRKLGWNPCGFLQNSIIYNGYLTDLILYDYDLREVK